MSLESSQMALSMAGMFLKSILVVCVDTVVMHFNFIYFLMLLSNEIQICRFFPLGRYISFKSEHICKFKENLFSKDFETSEQAPLSFTIIIR